MYVSLVDFNTYITKISLRGFSDELSGLVQRTANFADEVLVSPRRDGRKAVGHSLSVGQESMTFGLSPLAECVAIGHDFIEDGKLRMPDGELIPIGRDYLEEYFGPEYGPRIAFGIDAETVYPWEEEDRTIYYARFLGAVAQWWELLPIRLLDRKINHMDPYNGNPVKELAKCEETLGTFRKAMEEGSEFLPDEVQVRFAYHLHQTVYMAEMRVPELIEAIRLTNPSH